MNYNIHMDRHTLFPNLILCAAGLSLALLCGACSGSGSSGGTSAAAEVDYSVKGERDNTPRVLVPVQEEDGLLGNDEVEIDVSQAGEGYLSVRYIGDNQKVKLRMTDAEGKTYTYDLTTDGQFNVLPFSSGNGTYLVSVYINIEGKQYAEIFSTELPVTLENEFGPFLYPNQYCWFGEDSRAVAESARVCNPANDDLEAVTLIYNYVVSTIVYDWEEAENVQSGYLPDVDEVLETGKGICLDYSSLISSMLRSQNIPSRMEIGYAGTAYHAWISCYIDEIGWVNGMIQFDGNSWSLMDPTFAASQSEKDLKKFIGDGSNYKRVYLY